MWDIENRLALKNAVLVEAENKLAPNFGFEASRNLQIPDWMSQTFTEQSSNTKTFKV